jgi:hypothetical protein
MEEELQVDPKLEELLNKQRRKQMRQRVYKRLRSRHELKILEIHQIA